MELKRPLQNSSEIKQVCIASTVLNNHITLSCSDLNGISKLELKLIEQSIAYWFIGEQKLDSLISELATTIDNFLPKLELTPKHNIQIEYKDVLYALDFRNSNHFYLSALVDIYNMALTTSSYKSHIYVFNKSLLKMFHGESIIAQLRGTTGLTESQLFSRINLLWHDLRLNQTMDLETLQKGIEHLMFHGLIFKDKRNNEFSVTAMGYMYW